MIACLFASEEVFSFLPSAVFSCFLYVVFLASVSCWLVFCDRGFLSEFSDGFLWSIYLHVLLSVYRFVSFPEFS